MKCLLDTHALLWFLDDNPRLSLAARTTIENDENEKLITVEGEHVKEVARLPLHHRDPFDRMLVAQAKHGSMPLVSCDPALDAYRVQRIW